MDDILKIVKSLENSGVLLKGVSETIQNEAKEQRGGFLSMLLGTLGAPLLGDVLSKGLSGKVKEQLELVIVPKGLHYKIFDSSTTSFNKL